MFCGGINIDIFSNVLILIPVKILPVELFDAFLVKYLLVKHINKYSEEISIKLLEVMAILHYCMNTEATVITIKDNFRLDAGIQSKVLAFAFGLAAEIERNLISQRTRDALSARKANGMKLGRPFGAKNSKLKLSGYEDVIITMLNKGHTKNEIAQKLKVHRETLREFIKKITL